jgi:hypothetical protein
MEHVSRNCDAAGLNSDNSDNSDNGSYSNLLGVINIWQNLAIGMQIHAVGSLKPLPVQSA